MNKKSYLGFKKTITVAVIAALGGTTLLSNAYADIVAQDSFAASSSASTINGKESAASTLVQGVEATPYGLLIKLSKPLENSVQPGYFIFGKPGQGGGVAVDLENVSLSDNPVSQIANNEFIQRIRLVKSNENKRVRVLISIKKNSEPSLIKVAEGVLVSWGEADNAIIAKSTTTPASETITGPKNITLENNLVPNTDVDADTKQRALAWAAEQKHVQLEVANRPATPSPASTPTVLPVANSNQLPTINSSLLLSDNQPDFDITRLEAVQGVGGNGRIVIGLANSKGSVDIKSTPRGLVIDIPHGVLPPHLSKRFNNLDAGPITSIEAVNQGNRAKILVNIKNNWERSVQQLDKTIIIDVRPINNDTISEAKTEKQYKGEKITLNFQNVDVRALLQVIADYSSLNIVAADTVGGQMTLRLKDVPWDQALDIILNAKGLDKRQQNNVIWIAPKEELLTKEKMDLEAKQQIGNLAALVTESFQLNYHRAPEAKKLLGDQNQSLLSKRGSVTIDERTNMLFVQDSPERIEAIRALIKKIDIPVRQVLIEARIVEASNTFTKEVGARIGLNNAQATAAGGNGNMLIGSGLAGTGANAGQTTATTNDFMNNLGVNLPANKINGSVPTTLSFILFNNAATRFLNMELSALINDGKGTVLSNPRVVTADQQEAHIEQGTQIPYQQASGLGATSIAFKKAVLSLTVTPQITPDGRVIMKLSVTKDSVGQNTTSGPAIDTKQISTQVLVDNGGTVVIGGIYTQEETSSVNKVPVLGDLPYVGALFRNKSNLKNQKELLMFITPKVVNAAAGSLDDATAPILGTDTIKSRLIDEDLRQQVLKE